MNKLNDLPQAQIDIEQEGRRALRQQYGAHENETFGTFVARLAKERNFARREVENLKIALDGEQRARKREWDMKAEEVAAAKIRSQKEHIKMLKEDIDVLTQDRETHDRPTGLVHREMFDQVVEQRDAWKHQCDMASEAAKWADLEEVKELGRRVAMLEEMVFPKPTKDAK